MCSFLVKLCFKFWEFVPLTSRDITHEFEERKKRGALTMGDCRSILKWRMSKKLRVCLFWINMNVSLVRIWQGRRIDKDEYQVLASIVHTAQSICTCIQLHSFVHVTPLLRFWIVFWWLFQTWMIFERTKVTVTVHLLMTMNQCQTTRMKRSWFLKETYESAAEAENVVITQEIWKKKCSLKDNARDNTLHYRCKPGKYRKLECPASTYLLIVLLYVWEYVTLGNWCRSCLSCRWIVTEFNRHNEELHNREVWER